MPAEDLRGANQSLAGFSSVAGLSAASGRAGGSTGSAEGAAGAGSAAASASAAAFLPSASVTGLRTTTGGIGRDPGMLIRIRVVSVVSVLRSSGRAAERPASVPSSGIAGIP
ncbi:hypothetical protein F3L20_05145 [Streptomyces tendae]|uniref:Uncharacterized protein n=1 Tax=Streptomyces tendae TaxID=1932 RepID=A0ABX5ZL08_STRTE|nr:hypothetical protein F3L20_05145 [Streptomyces tendae]